MILRAAFFLVVFLGLYTGLKAQDNNQMLWYNHPAEKWTDALPIGNGRLGGMIYGGVAEDHMQFNEATLWSGKPRDYNKKGAYRYLGEIRKLLAEGKQKEAETLAQNEFMGLMSESGNRQAWVEAMRAGKGISGNPALENYDDRQWKTLPVPAYEGWETAGLTNVDGAVWFRTTFRLTDAMAGKDLVLDLNKIFDQDYTYINGKLVGSMDSADPRRYTIPANLLHQGVNTIAIQIFNFYDRGGIGGYKDTTKKIGIYPIGKTVAEGVSLVKAWKYKIQDQNPPAKAQYQASYQPFGDLKLKFAHQGAVTNYRRELDLTKAIAKTTYTVNGTDYKREYFASGPAQAIVIHLSANRAQAINFTASLSSVHQQASVKTLSANCIALSVQVKDGALKGESRLTAVVKQGDVMIKGNQLTITRADQVTLYLTAGTNFVNANDVSGNPQTQNIEALGKLKNQLFQIVKLEHISSYKRYYNTFRIDFGPSGNQHLPTDERLEQFAHSDDPGFVALYLQYGRYLLISSSRPGGQPANLQGIWNDLLSPPWGSKYTTNINMEMNYWPSELLNLTALNAPLFDKIKGLMQSGTETAKEYYHAKGWVLHHNTDIWNGTAPINASNHGIWVTGGAWLSEHLWEHYLFSRNRQFLRDEAYPVMKQAALFFNDFLVKDPKTGWLISTPSNSPENGGLVAGPTMDHQLIRSLFKSCIEASAILNVDEDFRRTLQEKVGQIAPNQIGRYGQLQEWLEDKDDTASKHRHVSHLWGVFPGNDITWEGSPKTMDAARQSLLYRGDEATGWSLAWKINFWARFKDGDHTMKLIRMLLKPAHTGAGSYVNLFDAHPPFQIDGNFGGAAGIAEMLVQSHQGYLDILPALPAAIPYGKVSGLRARGGFELQLNWDKGKLISLVVKSTVGGKCVVKYGDKRIEFDTKAGESYPLDGDLTVH